MSDLNRIFIKITFDKGKPHYPYFVTRAESETFIKDLQRRGAKPAISGPHPGKDMRAKVVAIFIMAFFLGALHHLIQRFAGVDIAGVIGWVLACFAYEIGFLQVKKRC
jgi:hypothetical protein